MPPGYTTASWPAAGIALTVLLLLRGPRVWPQAQLGRQPERTGYRLP